MHGVQGDDKGTSVVAELSGQRRAVRHAARPGRVLEATLNL